MEVAVCRAVVDQDLVEAEFPAAKGPAEEGQVVLAVAEAV